MQHTPYRSIRPCRARRLLPCLIALAAACGDPTGAPSDLVGAWHNWEPLQPSGSMERILRFDADGRFEQRILSYGIYGDPPAHLSASSVITGHYTRDSDRVVLRGESETDHAGSLKSKN